MNIEGPSAHLKEVVPPVPMLGEGADEAARLRLRRNRVLATALLVGMAVIFVATRMVPEPGFATLLIQSGAEAGMVGGLADWFAVTALFRHPLGLPIPHTAIVPSNKDRIGRALGRFVERNFLTSEAVLIKLRQMELGRRLATWLAAPATAPMLARSVAAALPYLIHSLRNRDLHDFLQRTLGAQMRGTDFAPLIARGIRVLTASGETDILFEHAIEVATRWLKKNRRRIDGLVSEHSRWWIPRAIDRRVAAALVNGTLELLGGLRKPSSEASTKFREVIDGLVTELLESSEKRERINAGVQRLLAHPETQAWLRSVADELAHKTLDDLARPASQVQLALAKPISIVARALATDEVMQRHIDSAAEHVALSLMPWRSEIGSFIAEVVRRWDAKMLTDRLELVVGSDLQYIRMNGTLVGACVGCLIFLVARLLG